MAQITIVQKGDPTGYQKLTVSNTAVGLTIPINSNRALIVVETASIRWRDDGTSPTSTDGIQIFQNQSLELDGGKCLSQFKAIKTGDTDATLHINYYYVS